MQNLSRMRLSWGEMHQRMQPANITQGKWRLEIAEMDLNHGLPRPTQAQTGSNKNNSSNQILIGSIRPGGQLSCYYFSGKWPNNLNRCLHPLHPTSRFWYTAKRINKTNIYPSHFDTKWELRKINSAPYRLQFCIFVLSWAGTIVRDHESLPRSNYWPNLMSDIEYRVSLLIVSL